MKNNHYPFDLEPLPYTYDALEPHIDLETLHFHHDKHLKTYVDNLNHALSALPEFQNMALEEILTNLDQVPEAARTAVKNNAGGVYNHQLYFASMKSAPSKPKGPVLNAIEERFGSYDEWKEIMKSKALAQFGSGYAWLVGSQDGHLEVINLPNQDTPLALGLIPLLPLDVWEHAYYLKYQNLRGTYVDNWFSVINWDAVNKRYEESRN